MMLKVLLEALLDVPEVLLEVLDLSWRSWGWFWWCWEWFWWSFTDLRERVWNRCAEQTVFGASNVLF